MITYVTNVTRMEASRNSSRVSQPPKTELTSEERYI